MFRRGAHGKGVLLSSQPLREVTLCIASEHRSQSTRSPSAPLILFIYFHLFGLSWSSKVNVALFRMMVVGSSYITSCAHAHVAYVLVEKGCVVVLCATFFRCPPCAARDCCFSYVHR
mmetsp:Transcript_8414/g.25193  ORF Transcript_8414/g.25193 Transcript_8414/m.25193 type:complete len:117 (+) Transcript_8414:3237-3587(+)|eukprot:scaffold105910_cov43-Tisochrysis_lutea.AAC.2